MIPTYENNALLKRPSKPWDFFQEDSIEKLVAIGANMASKMQEAGGIGLAAPQIEIDARIIVLAADPILVLVNPEILEAHGENVSMEEGCLSHPNLFVRVKRPDKVKVKYFTMGGDEVTFDFVGMTARVIQHELDHLDGNPFYHKATRLAIEKAKKARDKSMA